MREWKSVGRRDDLDARRLEQLTRADQLVAISRSVRIAIPVNMLLGLASALIALRYGRETPGLIWFSASSVCNVLRIVLASTIIDKSNRTYGYKSGEFAPALVDRQLRLSWMLALASGFVWAFIPVLCDGYTTPQTLFYLIVLCGITAGAVTHGTAYARVPLSFIFPPLLSAALCLFLWTDFQRAFLGATVLLYLGALTRSTRQTESVFRDASRLKHEATNMASSLGRAHAQVLQVAEEMGWRATHDPLTGLLNRAGFLQEMRQRSAATSPVCLMILDLDGFKSINDMFGHHAGDKVLTEVARRLREIVPESFSVARLGGDEFAIFHDLADSGEAPTALADRLIAGISMPFSSLEACRVGVSIGIHISQDASKTEMLTSADTALYAAKMAGRNRYYLFDAVLAKRLEMKLDIERDLSKSLEDGLLEVWFQPIWHKGGRVLSSFEALLRWRHPRHGPISPPEIVNAAATARLTEPLVRFILGQACIMMDMLRSRGMPGIGVAMNVSPREILQVPMDSLILETLASRQLDPARFEVEITEETALEIPQVKGKLAVLSAAGVRITVDDFGVGYSSLASLRDMPVDRVKIDRRFVSNFARSAADQALVQVVLTLGRTLDIEVVAEGVEEEEDLAMLRLLDCEFMQGFHLGRPMPMREALAWAEDHRPVVAVVDAERLLSRASV